MYNDFIKKIRKAIKNDRITIYENEPMMIYGYSVRRTRESWQMGVFSRSAGLMSDVLERYTWNNTKITNSFPRDILKNFQSLENESPYLFLPKGNMIHDIEFEKIDESFTQICDNTIMTKHYKDDLLLAALLINKVYSWRMFTGCELVRKEGSIPHQMLIWENWQKMGDYSKNLSDNRSIELFGMTNEEHHNEIINGRGLESVLYKKREKYRREYWDYYVYINEFWI
jgi:hypothetical protein